MIELRHALSLQILHANFLVRTHTHVSLDGPFKELVAMLRINAFAIVVLKITELYMWQKSVDNKDITQPRFIFLGSSRSFLTMLSGLVLSLRIQTPRIYLQFCSQWRKHAQCWLQICSMCL